MKSYAKRIGSFLNSTDGSLKKKTIRSGIWVGASKMALNMLSFIRTIILARLLTPEIFGLMSICMISIRGLEIFSETGFTAALIHRQKDFEEAKNTAFTLMIIRGIVLGLIAIIISPIVAHYYNREILDSLLKVLAITFILNGFYNINTIGLEKELDFKRLSYLEQLGNIFNFVVVLTLAYFFRSVWALVLGQALSSLISVVLSYVIIPGRPVFRFNKGITKELFGYGKFVTGLTIVVFVTTEIDNAIIGKLLGMDLLGFYVIAYGLANLPATHITKVISKVMFPVYSKLQHDIKGLRNAYLEVLRLTASITIPAVAGIGILAPEIIKIVYGEKWIPAILPLQILCIFGGFRAISALNGYVYNAIGRPNIPFYLNTGKLILIIAIIFPLTTKFSLIGTAIAVTIPLVIQFFIASLIFTRVIDLNLFQAVKPLIIPIMHSLIMAAAIIIAKKIIIINDMFELISLVIMGIFIYGLLNVQKIYSLIRNNLSLVDI